MIEEWRKVPDYEAFYEVSNFGRVRSVTRIVAASRGGFKTHKGKILKTRSHKFGYPMVTLSIHGKPISKTVHSLVAAAFLGPCPVGQQVRHMNNNTSDSSLLNLEYGTVLQNMEDKKRHGTQPYGELNYNSKLTAIQVENIRNRRAEGFKLSDIASEFGLTEIYVWQITTGKKWKSVGGPLTLKRDYLAARRKSA